MSEGEDFKEVRYKSARSQNKLEETDDGENNGNNYRYAKPSRKEVLDKVASGDIKPEEADKMLNNRKPPRFVVTRKGSIALYNLNRDPIILYADQWEKLEKLIRRDILKNFMERNNNIIKRKNKTYYKSENQ